MSSSPGSEWNACNYEELVENGITHILNVTSEIDSPFESSFDYLRYLKPLLSTKRFTVGILGSIVVVVSKIL